MGQRIEELIKKLQTRDPKQIVEYVVIQPDGDLVTIDIESKSVKMFTKLLKVFK